MASQRESTSKARGQAAATRYNDVAWVAHHTKRLGLGDPDRIELMASLTRTSRLMTSRMENTLAEFSLTLTQYLVLMTVLLSDDGERRLSDISRHMMVHPTTITVVSDQLEEMGFMKRTGDPTDRRVTLATMTRLGRTIANQATLALSEVNFGLPKISKQRTRQLIEQLAELRAEAGDE
jgi:DNA-binding MarR family transcriptional regulator